MLAATNDADINDVHGKGGSHGGRSHSGQTRNKGSPGSNNMSFGGIKRHYNAVMYAPHIEMHMRMMSSLLCALLHTLYTEVIAQE